MRQSAAVRKSLLSFRQKENRLLMLSASRWRFQQFPKLLLAPAGKTELRYRSSPDYFRVKDPAEGIFRGAELSLRSSGSGLLISIFRINRLPFNPTFWN
jgi:hypothetical protein